MKVRRNADSLGVRYDLVDLKPGEVLLLLEAVEERMSTLGQHMHSGCNAPAAAAHERLHVLHRIINQATK